jgi:hypothetical protein
LKEWRPVGYGGIQVIISAWFRACGEPFTADEDGIEARRTWTEPLVEFKTRGDRMVAL